MRRSGIAYTAEGFKERGYTKIVSEAQANQILRREIKFQQKQIDLRRKQKHFAGMRTLLQVRVGSWIKFFPMTNNWNGKKYRVLLVGEELK